MVTIDLGLSEVYSLAETGKLTGERLKALLEKFSKEDFVSFYMAQFEEKPEEKDEFGVGGI